MPTIRRHASVLTMLLLALVAIGCQPGAVESLLPAATGPLVSVSTRGGECPEGPCGSTTVIERDGTVHTTAPAEAELGTVPADVLTALDSAIKVADFDAIRAVPFQGECPVNFDGQELIFEFGAPGGTERIASCETAIDAANPVFAAVMAAFASVEAPIGL